MPAAKKPAETKTPDQETLERIALIVRHPEAAEHGGRNRYKREAIEAIKDLTKDVKVSGVVEAVIEVPGELEEADPEDDGPEAA